MIPNIHSRRSYSLILGDENMLPKSPSAHRDRVNRNFNARTIAAIGIIAIIDTNESLKRPKYKVSEGNNKNSLRVYF